MYSCLHIPSFPLSVLLRDDLEAARGPAALVSTAAASSSSHGPVRPPQPGPAKSSSTPVLLAVNQAAARFRVTPGLTTTRALARCPQLALLSPDPALERRHQIEFREFASSLVPDFEETAPGTILLDLLTLPHAQSSPLDWIEQALRKATLLRLPLHLALAPTPDLALLAAHSPGLRSQLSFSPDPEIRVEHSAFTISALSDLPLSTLTSSLHHSTSPSLQHAAPLDPDLLQLWGITNLGQLAALPRQGLAERLGPGAARLHDILHGKHHRLLTLHRPPRHFQAAQELEDPLDTLEPILFLLRRGLDTLCARLASSQRAAIAIRLTLTFDDGNLHLRDIRLPEPACDPDILLRPLHTHLDTIRAPAPVTAWSLRLTPTLPGEAQHHLFERSLRDPNKFADTLARLEALLGPDRLGTPVPLDTYKPDSFQMGPVWRCSQRSESPKSKVGKPGSRNPRPLTFDFETFDGRRPSSTALPLKRFRPPLEIKVASESRGRHQHPLALLTGPHRGEVAAAHGPFPLSGHWWDPGERWQHVEWDLQLSNRTLLRLAFTSPHQWRLEGIYE